MRRLTLHLLIAAVTFIFGVAVSRLSPKMSSPPKVKQPLAVSSCELQRNPEQYLGKLIRVRAPYVGNSTIYDWSCGSPDFLPSGLIYVDSPELGARWIGDNGLELIVDEGIGAEVVVVGIFEADYLVPNATADARHFRITAESVFRISAPSVQR
jgi:hypothetical protein